MKKDELKYIEIKNTAAEAKICLQGAHIFYFEAKGKKPLLYLSETALFKKGVPIRGGIPICWPWFGPHPSNTDLPNHGFARTSLWTHEKTQELSKEETLVTLSLKSSPQSKALWPYDFKLSLEISIGKELSLKLITHNLDTQAFSITSALHSYFKVNTILKLEIEGLEKKLFYNKVDDSYKNLQKEKIIFNEEIDRIYQEVEVPVVLKEEDQKISIKTKGSQSIVLWNPAQKLADKMPDLSRFETMVCVESANVLDDEIRLEPKQSHILHLNITQELI